jgi:hypothetical protein
MLVMQIKFEGKVYDDPADMWARAGRDVVARYIEVERLQDIARKAKLLKAKEEAKR